MLLSPTWMWTMNENELSSLNNFINNEKRTDYKGYSPESIRLLLEKAGNPHHRLKTVHIAGTNGKGSTAHYLSSIFSFSGYSCGLYTSPHLLELNERITINGEQISDNALTGIIDETVSNASELPEKPTFFDILTCAALVYFDRMKVDIAVIEAGLGGRLDSTNQIIPELSIITGISLDHTSVLGDTVEKIAAEKAGIIKQGVPVLYSTLLPEVSSIISSKASELNAPSFQLSEQNYTYSKSSKSVFSIKIGNRETFFSGILLRNIGRSFSLNARIAANAALILSSLYRRITADTIINGLNSTIVPGRFEVLLNDPVVIFDPAHNPEAVKELCETVKSEFPDVIINPVVSLMKDKNFVEILEILHQNFRNIIFCELEDERSLKKTELPANHNIESIGVEEIDRILLSSISHRKLLLFTGSFRLYKYVKDSVNRILINGNSHE